jgi:hypothetical protein
MTYVYIAIGLLVIGFLYLVVFGGKAMKKMKAYSEKAILDANNNHNIQLDLSTDSLVEVNKIIQVLHERGGNDTQEISMMYGGYIGEVIIQMVTKGFWMQSHPEMGLNTYPVKTGNGNYAFPVVWVSKHLTNGEEDNILHKFNSWKFTHDRQAAQA